VNKLGLASAMALCLAGAANAQLGPGDPPAGQAPTYAVEGLTLGSRVKSDSAAYREYKCGPSEQFDGFTWCQKTRRESERRGSFETTYSILRSKDGTIVYVNRNQQPAFFDASEADRDIQNYSRKFGGSPRITKMPRRSGSSDAILATWGKVELEPLDNESIRLLGGGKSPKKGFLVDFVGNFARSAQEGLPIYRIIGGAGFVWVGSFDQKGRGTLRFAAVDASALQPGPVAPQPPAARQNDDQEPSRKAEPPADAKAGRDEAAVARPQADLSAAAKERRDAELAAQAAAAKAGRDAETVVARLQAELSAATKERRDAELAAQAAATKAGKDEAAAAQLQAELSAAAKERRDAELATQAAIKARRDAEATVARLQAELSTAAKGRRDAELAAQEARTDAKIARDEFEAATNDANAAKEELDRLKAGGGAPASNVTGAILIGASTAAVLFFVIWAFSRMRSSPLRFSADAEKTDADIGDRQGAAVPSPSVSGGSAETEPSVDPDDLVAQLAKTLGVQDAAAPSPAEAPRGADRQEQAQMSTSGDAGSVPSEDPSVGSVLLISREDDREISKSVVPNIPSSHEVDEIKSAPEGPASQPENAGTS
jgi:multidrug efflux pump subunit AcrA (membrane-fusion protein)